MRKIVQIIHNIDKANEFLWLIDHIDKGQFELIFISLNKTSDTFLGNYCRSKGISFYHVHYHSKKEFISALIKTFLIIQRIKPEVVHAHIFEGGLIGITAAWLAGVKNRIYTRHYSNYHHKYARSGLKYDQWINNRATKIIAVSKLVQKILIEEEKVPEDKTMVIHHGFPLIEFENIEKKRVEKVKLKHKIPDNKFIVGVVSRYTYLKGIQFIIPAFKEFLQYKPDAHLVLANSTGDFVDEIRLLLKELPKGSYSEIIFEADNAALFRCFDVFIHAPVDAESEAFGQIYIEALLTGVPSIFSLSGVANEFIKNNENACVVPHQNASAIAGALINLAKNEDFRNFLSTNGRKDARFFSLERKIKSIEKIYSQH